jgi:hypothetical protein
MASTPPTELPPMPGDPGTVPTEPGQPTPMPTELPTPTPDTDIPNPAPMGDPPISPAQPVDDSGLSGDFA